MGIPVSENSPWAALSRISVQVGTAPLSMESVLLPDLTANHHGSAVSHHTSKRVRLCMLCECGIQRCGSVTQHTCPGRQGKQREISLKKDSVQMMARWNSATKLPTVCVSTNGPHTCAANWCTIVVLRSWSPTLCKPRLTKFAHLHGSPWLCKENGIQIV